MDLDVHKALVAKLGSMMPFSESYQLNFFPLLPWDKIAHWIFTSTKGGFRLESWSQASSNPKHMNLTFILKIGPKFEYCILTLVGVFPRVATNKIQHENVVMLLSLHSSCALDLGPNHNSSGPNLNTNKHSCLISEFLWSWTLM